jgi:hypothetical protein
VSILISRQPSRVRGRLSNRVCVRRGCAHVDIEVAIVEGMAGVVRSTIGRLTKKRPQEVNMYFVRHHHHPRKMFFSAPLTRRAFAPLQKDGTTPLILALKEKREDIVDGILSSPIINTELKDMKTGLYPFHLAIILGLTTTVKRFLDRPKIDIEVRDNRGMTPVMLAAMVGNEEYFTGLVEKGADLKVVDNEGWNILICAAYGGNTNIVDFLLEAGFDKDYEDKRKMTPYDWAMQNKKGEAAATIADFVSVFDDYDPDRARRQASRRRV